MSGERVTVTLVFTDEPHRMAWLREHGWLDCPDAQENYADFARDKPDMRIVVKQVPSEVSDG